MNIVSTNVPYNSNVLRQNLTVLLRRYPFLNVQTVGNSVLGKPIYAVKLGRGQKSVFYSASFHANEWITTPVLMKFIEDYANAYVSNGKLYGYSVRNLFNTVSIFIMPMVNPDGVNLVTNSFPINSVNYNYAKQIADDFPDIPFTSGWKANIRGVDLNLQFPARMGKCKRN